MAHRFLINTVIFWFMPLMIFAQESAPAKGQQQWSPFVGILLMLAVFFFFIMLPQSRKAKKQAHFLANLEKGDAIVTQGGLYGKIHGLADRIVTLEIAPNVKIRIDRQSIASKDAGTGGNKG